VNPPEIDVSTAPSYAFGHRGAVWWGTMAIIATEGMMFAMLVTSYLYLRTRNTDWPPGFFPPYLLWGSANLALLIASALPNYMAKRAAVKFDLAGVRLWMAVCLLFGIGFMVLRYLEFRSLNVWWDSNAYGSAVWLLLGFHSFHIVTDFIDSAVLLALMCIGPIKESRFVDVDENSMYWNFVVVTWIPVYALIYLAPRYW
jgi:heme/copper-type cytochrome/quinol oxidase subunit 3